MPVAMSKIRLGKALEVLLWFVASGRSPKTPSRQQHEFPERKNHQSLAPSPEVDAEKHHAVCSIGEVFLRSFFSIEFRTSAFSEVLS